jgi:hypothetical protein
LLQKQVLKKQHLEMLNNMKNIFSLDEFFHHLLKIYKHTILKISGVSFKRKYETSENAESISILVENLKITWNKFNTDVIQLLLFDDVFLIVDKIILKLNKDKVQTDSNNEPEKQRITILDLGKFNFEFHQNFP